MRMDRRRFLYESGLGWVTTLVAGGTLGGSFARARAEQSGPASTNSTRLQSPSPGSADTFDAAGLRVGLLTDLHHADKPPAGTRHYRDTRSKLREATERFRAFKVECVVELGDFIDAADSVDVELGYLRTIEREFAAGADDRHYVLGNHCVDTLTKAEFLGEIAQETTHKTFVRKGWRFVILDSCFRSDGVPYQRRNFDWRDANVPADQLEWLGATLESSAEPVIVFAHQRLDVADAHGVKNAAAVRRELEKSGKVRAVFQGHSHQNDLKTVANIPYCTLVAVVEGAGMENSGYGILELRPDQSVRLHGFRRQESRSWL